LVNSTCEYCTIYYIKRKLMYLILFCKYFSTLAYILYIIEIYRIYKQHIYTVEQMSRLQTTYIIIFHYRIIKYCEKKIINKTINYIDINDIILCAYTCEETVLLLCWDNNHINNCFVHRISLNTTSCVP